jgi:hypothetical protein
VLLDLNLLRMFAVVGCHNVLRLSILTHIVNPRATPLLACVRT